MVARNNITGDQIATKRSNDAYRDGWDRIFGKKEESFAEVNEPGISLKALQKVAEVKVTEVPLPKPVVTVDAKAEQEIEYRREWWAFCEKNSSRLKAIPHFEEYMSGKYEFTDEGNTPD